MHNLTITPEGGKTIAVVVADREAAAFVVDGYLLAKGFDSSLGRPFETLFPQEACEGDDPITWVDTNGVRITFDAIEPEVSESKTDSVFHYVLMRMDVPDYLSGKAMAQANHAGTQVVIHGYRKKDAALTALLDEWEQQGDGFGTCIVLSVSAAEMRQAVSLANLLGIHAGTVHDPSYPLRDGEKIQTIPLDTCAFLLGRHSECYPVVGKFPLLRGKGE